MSLESLLNIFWKTFYEGNVYNAYSYLLSYLLSPAQRGTGSERTKSMADFNPEMFNQFQCNISFPYPKKHIKQTFLDFNLKWVYYNECKLLKSRCLHLMH